MLPAIDKRKDFENAINGTYNLIYTIIYTYTNDFETAKDLTQETCLKAYSSLGSLRDIKSLKPWLCTIARNCAINWKRKKKEVSNDNTLDIPTPNFSPLAEYEAKEAHDIVNEAIDKLNPMDKEILIMRYVGKMSYQEIASIIGASEHAIGNRLYRMVKKIRENILPFFEDKL